MKLDDIKKEFEKYIVIRDKWILNIIMATAIGNYLIPRDPIWLMIVGVSSGGKSTFIAPCADFPKLRFIDDLTEKTLLSGYKVKGQDSSLLKQMGSGIMAFSDFTSILSKNPMSRGEILTQLKLVYDGKLTKVTGTGTISWEGKMGFIGGATPDVYQYMESGRSMGERFLYYWLDQPTDLEIATKQAKVALSSKEIADLMKPYYAKYFFAVEAYTKKYGVPKLKMTPEQHFLVRQAAVFCVNGKATVHLDFKTSKADSIPNKAGVGRDYKAFEGLLHTLQLMRCYETDNWDSVVEDDDIALMQKFGYSSINRERRKILEILCSTEKPLTTSDIGAVKGLGLPKESVEKYLIPLNAVGLVQKNTDSNAFKWFIDDRDTKDFINRVSETFIEEEIIIPPSSEVEEQMAEEVAKF